MPRFLLFALAGVMIGLGAPSTSVAEDRFIIVQSTTSTQNSGLFDAILPQFLDATGIEARVVAVGTGQALRNAANCDGDVVVVHARAAEDAFVAAGYGTVRADLMANEFVVIGPAADPAGVAGVGDVLTALQSIAAAGAPFASRGDDSGTHIRERALWDDAGIDPVANSGGWYRETGSGMGATLNIAVGMNAYTLADRGTWLAFENQASHRVLLDGDPALFNQYGIIPVSPDHCPAVRGEAAAVFVDWMVSPEGQAAIAAHRIDGQQLFFPNAREGAP